MLATVILIASIWKSYKVVAKQLHNQRRVLVALLAQSVKLCRFWISKLQVNGECSAGRTGNSIIESLLGQVASLVRSVKDLVVEDGEVKGETKADGVGGRKLSLGNLSSSLVGLEGLVGRVLAAVANSELGEVTVVVTLPVYLVNTNF